MFGSRLIKKLKKKMCSRKKVNFEAPTNPTKGPIPFFLNHKGSVSEAEKEFK
jgi:hypothetical protein